MSLLVTIFPPFSTALWSITVGYIIRTQRRQAGGYALQPGYCWKPLYLVALQSDLCLVLLLSIFPLNIWCYSKDYLRLHFKAKVLLKGCEKHWLCQGGGENRKACGVDGDTICSNVYIMVGTSIWVNGSQGQHVEVHNRFHSYLSHSSPFSNLQCVMHKSKHIGDYTHLRWLHTLKYLEPPPIHTHKEHRPDNTHTHAKNTLPHFKLIQPLSVWSTDASVSMGAWVPCPCEHSSRSLWSCTCCIPSPPTPSRGTLSALNPHRVQLFPASLLCSANLRDFPNIYLFSVWNQDKCGAGTEQWELGRCVCMCVFVCVWVL